MLLVQRVVEVTPKPGELWNLSEHLWRLNHGVWLPFVSLSHWEQLLVWVRVDDLVRPVVVGFLPVVLCFVRRIDTL